MVRLGGAGVATLLMVCAFTGQTVLTAQSKGAGAQPLDVTKILKGVEDRYNSTKTLKADFKLLYRAQGRARAPKSGVMYLSKPGKTRWDYSNPEGELFVSDGKYSYSYDPDDKRAVKEKMKDTDDVRIPLAFLLGKLDFQRDFDEFRAHAEGPDAMITAIPKSDKLIFTEISMLIAPDSMIKKAIITGQDYSTMEFDFSNEMRNQKLDQSLFTFQAPAGVNVVEE